MSFYLEKLELETVEGRPSYHMITDKVKEIVKSSDIKNGICLVQTTHTTCSVYFDEYMHDKNYYEDDFLQVDLNNVLEKVVPRQTSENYPYLSPGPEHIAYGMKKTDPNYPALKWSMLNTDGHLRSDLLGSSVSLGIYHKELLLGSVGQIFFVDFDQTRTRKREVEVVILGDKDE
ncbi:YjbQ family protein [Xylocopilactobacillus apis]|uniref:Secondary thiamine-phosphate synthase enzyme n=1 Tax=Xylocopilactobacillus apis TaxID=2932183 RepID=A0AAU9DBB1_9LACO|nr:YjbQ family protein [Xylocopilactobacillus apis]BDR57045.1 secondary thiamine-phosphate synthase enzyme [Xylocopilactobacillus apis]